MEEQKEYQICEQYGEKICNCEVNIKLHKKDIPDLLGAVTLGRLLEDICVGMIISADHRDVSWHDFRWNFSVDKIRKSIIEQTKISEISKGWATDTCALDDIRKFAEIRCKKYKELWEEYDKSPVGVHKK